MSTRNPLLTSPPFPVDQATKTLGANLRNARLRRNLSIQEVAQKIGTGPRAVADAEKGKASRCMSRCCGRTTCWHLSRPWPIPRRMTKGWRVPALRDDNARAAVTSSTMIFKAGQRECFVYITLPGHSIPVTAGKFTLTPDRTGTAIDRYRYGKSYLGRPDAVPLNPIELQLSHRTYSTAALRGVFGALRDARPDA